MEILNSTITDQLIISVGDKTSWRGQNSSLKHQLQQQICLIVKNQLDTAWYNLLVYTNQPVIAEEHQSLSVVLFISNMKQQLNLVNIRTLYLRL
jgi:hypothetical protein